MAQIALRKTANEAKPTYPEAAKVLSENTYMDDICDSVTTVSKAQQVTSDIDKVLASGGFQVKGWISNREIGEEKDENQESETTNLLENVTEEKVLGLVWKKSTDAFTFKVKADLAQLQASTLALTKRLILSNIARVFDPIGFAAAFLIRAKIGMQRLWQLGVDWDEKLSEAEQSRWVELFAEMNQLNHVSFDRCLTPEEAIGLPILCIFADASQDAFGAVAYIRWRTSDGSYQVRFIAAKSRVAPLKQITIPRLELQAAVIATRLYKTIVEETRLQFEKAVFFSDSMIVVEWIRSQARAFKTFVSVRVAEIQNISDPAQWRHVPGEVNVADDVSRGISVQSLTERWKHGPEFLCLPEQDWPQSSPAPDQEELNKERRKIQNVCTATAAEDIIDHQKFSSWRKLVRVTARIQRLAARVRSKNERNTTSNDVDETDTLMPATLRQAEQYWIKEAQKGLHDRVKKGEFRMLSPFTDEDGLIRVGGRVDKAVATYDTRHPVMLPYKHWISHLITVHVHQHGHTGVAATAAKVRRNYWIIRVHDLAKKIKFRCAFCKEMEHKSETQLMSELPECRVAPHTPPFYYSSCDYFGPYHVKISRNKKTKHYGVIFTCLNTRAVHLELAVDCSAESYLQVLRRFFAIRGQPKLMISDNGTQLVGAERELREMIQGWEISKLRDFCAERGMEWKFTTPGAPHQNGCAEALVKSCKYALKKAIGEQVLTAFELYTCLMEVANLVNQRPIGRIPNDPDDGAYLCPNDMLLGRASSEVPQGPFKETKNPRHRVEFVQRIVDSFWRRWSRDVFPQLVLRKKWNVDRRNVRDNDVVMMADENAVRGKWVIGRVIQVYPGVDQKIRNVRVKTASGEYRRPVTKIAVIYPAEGYQD